MVNLLYLLPLYQIIIYLLNRWLTEEFRDTLQGSDQCSRETDALFS